MSARIFSYEDANPVTFHIQPYFPANAVTDFIALFFTNVVSYLSSAYAALYTVLYTIATWSFHDIDTLRPVLSLVKSQNWFGLSELILSGPWDALLVVLYYSTVLYLYCAGYEWTLLFVSIFTLGPWNLVMYGWFLLFWYWSISVIAKVILPLMLIKIYRAIYNHFIVYQHLDAGRGGTPADAAGWFRLWRLRLFGQIPSNFEIHVSPFLKPYRGILHADYLPKREDPSGKRPTIIGTAPQRQKDQKTSIKQYELLSAGIAAKAAKYARDLTFEGSFFEAFGGTQALRLRRRDHPAVPEIRNDEGNVTQVARAPWSNTTDYINRRPFIKQFGYELCHAHHADGSMHVVLHPEDVRTVIEQGWGERHPLACTTWIWMTYFKLKYKFITKAARPPVPETFVFVYAPKNQDEIETVLKIVDASIWYFTGKEVGSNVGRGPEIQDRYDDDDGFRQPKSTLDEVDKETADAEYAALKLAAVAKAARDAVARRASQNGSEEAAAQEQQLPLNKEVENVPAEVTIRGGLIDSLPDGLVAEERSIYDILSGVLQRRLNAGQKAPKLVIITDLAKDYDDLAAMVVLKELHRLDLVELQGFVANLLPAYKRALFGRGALDRLGLQDIPIAIGLRASPDEHEEHDYEFNCSFMAPKDTQYSLENGNVLLRRLFDTAKEENEKLTFVLLSSLSDAFQFSEEYQNLQDIISKVFLQGGYTVDPLLQPDFAAANNKFDPDAANGFHKFMYTHNIPSAVYTKIATTNTPTTIKIFEDLEATGHSIGQHLAKVRLAQDEVFYKQSCLPNPPFFDQRRFLQIKTTWFDSHSADDPLPPSGDFEAIRPYLTKVVVYDALPALASAGADVLQALGIKDLSHDLHEIVGVAKTATTPEIAGMNGVNMAKALSALMRGSLLASMQGL